MTCVAYLPRLRSPAVSPGFHDRGPLPAVPARHGAPLVPVRVYVAVPDHHLLVRDGLGRRRLHPRPDPSAFILGRQPPVRLRCGAVPLCFFPMRFGPLRRSSRSPFVYFSGVVMAAGRVTMGLRRPLGSLRRPYLRPGHAALIRRGTRLATVLYRLDVLLEFLGPMMRFLRAVGGPLAAGTGLFHQPLAHLVAIIAHHHIVPLTTDVANCPISLRATAKTPRRARPPAPRADGERRSRPPSADVLSRGGSPGRPGSIRRPPNRAGRSTPSPTRSWSGTPGRCRSSAPTRPAG